jgi:hypothetical protein
MQFITMHLATTSETRSPERQAPAIRLLVHSSNTSIAVLAAELMGNQCYHQLPQFVNQTEFSYAREASFRGACMAMGKHAQVGVRDWFASPFREKFLLHQ